jgi:hypothetical protein
VVVVIIGKSDTYAYINLDYVTNSILRSLKSKLEIIPFVNNYMFYPILIYDNMCTSCTYYAKFVNKLLGGKIIMLGHYTLQGKELKQSIFPKKYDGLNMSWFVTEKKAYGGRECMKQLIKYGILTTLVPNHKEFPRNNFALNECASDCKTVKAVLIRSCSIITSGKIIEVNQNL